MIRKKNIVITAFTKRRNNKEKRECLSGGGVWDPPLSDMGNDFPCLSGGVSGPPLCDMGNQILGDVFAFHADVPEKAHAGPPSQNPSGLCPDHRGGGSTRSFVCDSHGFQSQFLYTACAYQQHLLKNTRGKCPRFFGSFSEIFDET